MAFEPPKPAAKIPPDEKDRYLDPYFAYYAEVAQKNPKELRLKIPRAVLQPYLDVIGSNLHDLAKGIANSSDTSNPANEIRTFLKDHPIPGEIGKHLTGEMRSYALLIRALLNWCVGQSLFIDRWVISGNARKTLRSRSATCIVTGNPLKQGEVELHHPARDGRPPIPVSKKGHKIADDVFDPQDPLGKRLVELRRQRQYSWKLIWQGCLVELDQPVDLSEYGAGREKTSATAARWFARQTELPVQEILNWIESNELVDPVN
jgi:hypothetical protein